MKRRAFVVLALAATVGLAFAASPFASGSPVGLEKVAAELRFIDQGRLAGVQAGAPIPEYVFPGVGDERLATGLAGFVGTLLVFGAGFGLARLAAAGGRRSGRSTSVSVSVSSR